MRRKHQLFAVLVGACLMLALPAAPCRAATTITVNSNSDISGQAGYCVLRDAITAANTNTTTGGCSVGAGGAPFTILFDSSLDGDTITLGSTLPTITSPTILTITGPTSSSSGITIDGNNSVQIMQVNSGATVTLQYLTLENGSALGPSGFSGYGGAILNDGTLTVSNSTFSGNTAVETYGGAISNDGTLTVTNSTFSRNTAVGYGGAIYNYENTLTVSNSTFSGNTAGGGGAISNEIRSTASLKSTILAASTGGNCGDNFGVTDAGYNISDDNSCGFSGLGSKNNTNPELDPLGLANNGGPTQTIALQPGGLANALVPVVYCSVQSNPPQPVTTDQRGFPRPAPSHSNFCSAGAFEYNPPFFNGEVSQGNQLYYLQLANGFFGYYSYQYYPNLYHFWLGFEQVSDANDGLAGVFFYDYGLQAFLYTNPSDFPYFFDYASNSWLWYYVGTSRYFYDFGPRGLFFSPPG